MDQENNPFWKVFFDLFPKTKIEFWFMSLGKHFTEQFRTGEIPK